MKVNLSDTQAYTSAQENPTNKQIPTLSKKIQKLAKNGITAPNLKKFLDHTETHGACVGTLGLMECQKYVLYVVRKR